MAGRKMVRPLFSRSTSCSCSHSKARSTSLRMSRVSAAIRASPATLAVNLPTVVSASWSTPRAPCGRVDSQCSSNFSAALRRRSAMRASACQGRFRVTLSMSGSPPRLSVRLLLPSSPSRLSPANPAMIWRARCGSAGMPWSLIRCVSSRRCNCDASPTPRSGASSLSAAITADSRRLAVRKRFFDEFSTATCT